MSVLKRCLATTVLIAALASSAMAQSRVVYITGNELKEMCRVDQASCGGYIIGIADALEATAWPAKRSCRPRGVEASQIIDLAIETLRKKPAERHRPAFDLIADEVIAQWPC
ncbi:hypothetical protein SAMN05216456_1599 [Devosia crocina]|uniref:Rap1a immunity protein domain-containing protein n=1 Tax=Devosia crocina TaxID=429728 RepID=A0A1I7NC86_9HYPH|nr:Rap1a/Tai family immunity protein [Devosia crocina]SFV32287.1 hypothetical protein SAMN05216456_1599 [Devosia crocina]